MLSNTDARALIHEVRVLRRAVSNWETYWEHHNCWDQIDA